MIPQYKIEIYDVNSVLLHTVQADATELYFKDLMNNAGVGNFKFNLPIKKADEYVYHDISLNDQVKIYLGRSLPANPNFIGQVTSIESPANSRSGFTREISGLSKGEILLRRIKSYNKWIVDDVHNVVDDLCDDLSLGKTKVVADTTDITLEVDHESYAQILQRVSDYWYDAGTQIKKDYYLDTSDDLVWKARPMRTTNLEPITVDGNVVSYNVSQKIEPVKNNISVFGKRVVFNPLDAQIYGRKYSQSGDDWTYAGSGWTYTKGTVSQEVAGPVAAVGADWMKMTVDAVTHDLDFSHDLESTVVHTEGLAGYTALEFWSLYDGNIGINNGIIRLYAPDNANYYQESFTYGAVADVFKFNRFSIGENETYDATTNPSGIWVPTGSPSWSNIQDIWFGAAGTGVGQYIGLDGLCFNFGRWRYEGASDSTSQTAYGQRDLVVTDDNLGSDAECETRAKTLLYQLKDPPKQVMVVVHGTDNILLGDRIPLTIPAANISAVDFDVIAVEQHVAGSGDSWLTTATMVNSGNIRKEVIRNLRDITVDNTGRINRLGTKQRWI